MKPSASTPSISLVEAAAYTPQQVVALADQVVATSAQLAQLQHQLDWFKRQLFGQKSERRGLVEPNPAQLSLAEDWLPPAAEATLTPEKKEVAAHTRKTTRKDQSDDAESLSFFDESRVPVETIEVINPAMAGLDEGEYELIGYKESFRLAQRPASYVVLKYRRPIIRLKQDAVIHCPPAPQGVLGLSRADVSFVAGLIVDKLAYHLPLYRQHLRLRDAGISVSRPWLTQLAQQGIALLEPIYQAQLASILASRVKLMDETPVKAGQAGQGKLKASYFWPIYGEQDEVCFPWFESRHHRHVETLLGPTAVKGGVLVSDGYSAYTRYAEKTGLTQAQCWAHTRRYFIKAEKLEPVASGEALDQIGALYGIEKEIRELELTGEARRAYRQQHARPKVVAFFNWVNQQFEQQGLLPSSPLTAALAYARERRSALMVYLDDDGVPIDTNHLERTLRPIPLGRKNWLFCWTELGAHQIGMAQSLIMTCRLQNIDPYDYLVDVLQRVSIHPASQVEQLTPRQWKIHFAANPLRSDAHPF